MKEDIHGISIIIPVYNGELFLEECILSIINQPNKNLEIIIIDDGSTDNSQKIYNKYLAMDSRIRVFKQKNKGVSSARNKGIFLAKYDYISFLDCDDIWCNNFFDQEVYNLLDKGFDIIGFTYSIANYNLTRIKKINVEPKELINCEKLENILYYNGRSHSSFIYKTELIKENNIYIYGSRNEDNIFRDSCLYKAQKIKYISKNMFLYRNNPYSVTHKNIDVDILYKGIISNWFKFVEWLLQFEDENSKVVEHYKNLISLTIFEMIQAKSKLKLYLFNDSKIIEDELCIYLNRESAFKWNNNLFREYKLFMNKKYIFYLKYFILGKLRCILKKISNLRLCIFIRDLLKYNESINFTND